MPPHIQATTPAQRLRRLLGVKDKSHARVLQRHRHGVRVDALEPRVMLSAEWMAMPSALDRQQTFVVEPNFTPGQAGTTFMPVIDGLSRQVQENKTNEVLFVDAGVQDSQQLVSDLLASRRNTDSPTYMDVVVLDSARDGLSQIGQWLSQRSDIRAVHLISHGTDGALQLGGTTVDAQTLGERAADVAAWSKALGADADLLIYGCDVAQTAAGQSMLERLANLTGADVAASMDVTGGAAADWDLEFHTGAIEAASLSAVGYRATLAIAAADLKLGADSDATKVSLQEQWGAALNGLESAMDKALADTLVNQKLPGLNQSVNEKLGLDTDINFGENLKNWDLAGTAITYFNRVGANADLAGLANELKLHIVELLGNDLPWLVNVSAEVIDVNGTPTARLGLEFSVRKEGTKNFETGVVGNEGALPAISNAFNGDQMDALITQLSAVVSAHIDMAMTGLTTGAQGATFAFTGTANGADLANSATTLVFNRFDLAVQAKTGPKAALGFSYDLQAGIAARLRAADGSLGVTLADWLINENVNNSNIRLDVQRQSSLVGQVPTGLGGSDSSQLGIDTKGLIGIIDGNLLKAQTVNDVALTGSVRSAFNNILTAMAKLGSQIDGQSQLNRSLPMVDLNYTQLLTMNDGRTLGDVLAFKLAGGGNVLTDYVASSSAPTLTGLIDRLRQYLSGTGAYAGVEAMMSAELAASFMGASGLNSSTATVRLNGTLTRQFMARFAFNSQLDDVGLAFALGQGVPMLETVTIDMLWAVGITDLSSRTTATTSNVTVSTLQVNVDAVGAGNANNLDAAVVVGTLDARLQGTLNFQTDTVSFAVNGRAAMAASAIRSVAEINESRLDNNPDNNLNQVVSATSGLGVYAAADLSLSGTFAGVTLSDLAGATPRIVAYHDVQQTVVANPFADDGNAGLISDSLGNLSDALNNADWQAFTAVDSDTLRVSKQNFAALQKFAAINATDFTQLLGDVGYFLEQLRKSDQFTTALPFTDTTLGEAVDFSALMNELIETQFKEIANSGVSGVERVSPVLERDVGFTIKYQRPGDAYDTLIDVVIRAADTAGFTDVRQLAELMDKTIAKAMGGVMAYSGDVVVSEKMKGTLINDTTPARSEEQKLTFNAGSGAYKLSLDGANWTDLIDVQATAAELQIALAVLTYQDYALTNTYVQVTGTGSERVIQFKGALAGTDMPALQVMAVTAQVTQQTQGGLKVADTVSHEVQKVELHASSGDYRVSLNGTDWSGPIAVHGSAKALQNALENLAGVGKGNVLVTGVGKNLTVEFVGDLAERDMALVQVRFESNATPAGWLNVVASDFSTSAGLLNGKINIFESVTNTFSKFEIRPTSGVAIDLVLGGTERIEETQRIVIVNGAGGTITLSGSFMDKSFTTAPIDVGLDGAWSTRIQNAIRTALVGAGLSTADAGKITVLPAQILLPDGTQAFDVKFGAKGSQEALTADFSSMLGRMGVGVAAYQLQAATPGLADKTSSSEIQRLVFDNVRSGTFSLSLALPTKELQTNDISWAVAGTRVTDSVEAAKANTALHLTDSAILTAMNLVSGAQLTADQALELSARELQANILAILQQADEALTSDQIVVKAVAGLSAGTRAFDVEFIGTQGFGFCNCESPGETLFQGDLQGEDMPQFQVNTYRLLAQNQNPGLDNLTALGFDAGGAELQQNQVTTFSSIMEVMSRVQTFVNAHLPEGSSFGISPSFDKDTQQFQFKLKLVDNRLQSVGLNLPESVGDASDPTAPGVTGIVAEGTLDLSTEAVFEATIGIDFNKLLPFDVVASGLPSADVLSQTVLAADSLTAPITLDSATALTFEVSIDNQTFSVTVPATGAQGYATQAGASYTTTVQSLTTAIQSALDGESVAPSSPLRALDVAHLGQMVKVTAVSQEGGGYKLKFTATGSIERFGLDAVTSNMVDWLGFAPTNMLYAGPPSHTILDEDGVLSDDATFYFVFDVNADPVEVVLEGGDYGSRQGLVDAINDKFAETPVVDNAYLGTGGMDFDNLSDLVKAQLTVQREGMSDARVSLGFITQNSKVASMEIRSAGDGDTASTELGITRSQSSQTRGAELFLQDVQISGKWSTQMYDPTPLDTTDNNLKYEGSASLGMLSLDFGSVLVDSAGAFSFELTEDAQKMEENGGRMQLNDLFDKVQVQSTQLGLGSAQTVKSKDITLVLPVVTDGKLNTDVALKVVIGEGSDVPLALDVVIRKADTLDNLLATDEDNRGKPMDLAADVNAAIQEAVEAKLLALKAYLDSVDEIEDAEEQAEAMATDAYKSARATFDAYAGHAEANDGKGDWLNAMPEFVTADSIATPSTDLSLTAPAADDLSKMMAVLKLKSVLVDTKPVVWKVTSGRLANEVITPIVYTNAESEAGTSPTAELTLGKLAANGWWLFDGGNDNGEPSDAYALRDATTVVKLKVDNMAAVLAGDAPMALQSVVPPNGLGVYTPLKDVSWKSVSDQLSAIGDIFSNLDGMGVNGELAQALPMLNTTLSEIFNFDEAFAGVQDRLSTYKDVQLQDLKAMLVDVFGLEDEDEIRLQIERDGEGRDAPTTALRIQLPFAVNVDLTDRFQWIFDPKFRALVATMQFDDDGDPDTDDITGAEFLSKLLGSMTGMGDDKGNAPTRLSGAAVFQLDFGIDLSGTWEDADGEPVSYADVDDLETPAPVTFVGGERFGQVYLVDREETDDEEDLRTGTRVDLHLITSTTGMAFDSNMGLFSARVSQGSLNMSVASEVRIDSIEEVAGQEVNRTWLSDYKTLVDEASAGSNARTRAALTVPTLIDSTATDAVVTTVMLPLTVTNGVSEIHLVDETGEAKATLLIQADDDLADLQAQLADQLTDGHAVTLSQVDVLSIGLNSKASNLQVENDPDSDAQAWLDNNGQLQIEQGARFKLNYNIGSVVQSTGFQVWLRTGSTDTADLAYALTLALNFSGPDLSDPDTRTAKHTGAPILSTLVAEGALVVRMPTDWQVELQDVKTLLVDLTKDGRFGLVLTDTTDTSSPPVAVKLDTLAGQSAADLRAALNTKLGANSPVQVDLLDVFSISMPANVSLKGVHVEETGDGNAWIDATGGLNVTGDSAYTLTFEAVTTQNSIMDEPVVSSAVTSANGGSLVLTFDQLLGSQTPDASAFSVLVAGATRTVQSVSLAGSQVWLQLATPVQAGQAVKVAYTQPMTGSQPDMTKAVQGTTGKALEEFDDRDVTVVIRDSVAPVLRGVTQVGDQLTLTYSETLQSTGVSLAELAKGFVVQSVPTLNAQAVTVAVTSAKIENNTVVLKLASTPTGTVTVSDTATPVRTGATHTVTQVPTRADVHELTLAYSGTLPSTGVDLAALAKAYVLEDAANHSMVATSAKIENGMVILRLASAPTGDVSVVSDPWSDLIVSASEILSDMAGNHVAEVQATVGTILLAATNTSGQADAVAPSLVHAMSSEGGGQVQLVFSEALQANIDTTALATLFKLQQGGSKVSIGAVQILGNVVILRLQNNLQAGAAIELFYQPGVSNAATGNAAIQDLAGNDAAMLGRAATATVSALGQAVTNMVRAPERVSFETAVIAAGATAVEIQTAVNAALHAADERLDALSLTVAQTPETALMLRTTPGWTMSLMKGRDLAQDDIDAYRAERMAVDLQGTLKVTLPMSVVFSSGLAELAENAPEEMGLGDFINPMPVGTLVAEFNDLGSWMAYKGGAAFEGTTVIGSNLTDDMLSVHLAEAIPPAPNANGNGTGDAPVPEGTPVDQDFEDQLTQVQPDPYRILQGGGLIDGGGSSGGGGGGGDGGGSGGSTPAPVYDIDLTLPNFKYWQDVAAQLIALSGADGCDPDEPENPGLLMLLRDPAQVVDTIDQILEQIQTQLNNLFGDISLPFIQSQLSGAIGFIDELRVDLLGALREAIESTYKMYGGVDNALRMFMFDILTTDMNDDWVIDASDMEDEGYNLFLNFLRDFNGDGDITADDIVIEYLLTSDSEEPAATPETETQGNNDGPGSFDPSDAEYSVDMAELSWSAGRRAAWVTSGMNEAILAMVEPDGSDYDEFEGFFGVDDDPLVDLPVDDANAIFAVMQAQDFGDYQLLIQVPSLDANGQLVIDENGDPVLTEVKTQDIAFDADAEAIQQALVLAMSVAMPGIEITQDDVEVIELVNPDDSAAVAPLMFAVRLSASLNAKFEAQRTQILLEEDYAELDVGLTDLIGFDYGDSCYTSHAGKVVLDSSFDDNIEEMAGVWTGVDTTEEEQAEAEDAVRQEVRGSVLEAANAIQFRMNLGQSYEWGQDLSFDLGLDSIPLELSMTGELVLEVKWDVFLGFGIDLDEGFYLVTRSMDHAGIGAVTDINSADGYSANDDDEHIANLWAVEEDEEDDSPINLNTFNMESFLGMFEAPEAAELPETEEIIISANVYLRGLDTDGDGEEDTPASLNGRLLFLGGQLTDLWTDTIKNTDAEDVEVSEDMAWGEDGKGSRTQMYAFFKIDITDGTGADEAAPADEPAAAETPAPETTPAAPDAADAPAADEPVDDGRLTFAKFMEADLTDLFETSWKALAQVNLNAKLGLSVGSPLDFLPTIQTEFHLYWGMGSEDAEEEKEDSKSQMAKLAEGLGFELPEGEEEPEYFDMFTSSPTVWFSDVRLDLGTFFTEFMMPVADRVFEVIGPLIPVIKALTTPIPGLSQLMGKDYTAVDLAVDMAKLFGGETKVEFIVAVVKMVRTLIDMYEDVSANGGNFAIPIAEVLVLSAAENGEADPEDKPEVEEKGDKSKADDDEDNPSSPEGSAKETTDNLEDNADEAGSALAFPFLDDLFGTTIDLLLGNPVDLVTFTPPDLVVEVKFRFGAKIFYIFDVGIYGTLKFGARLTFGYDTYGIMKFLDTKEVLDIFDGFYVSDNVVNGVDLPEIFLETKLGVYVGLDLGVVKLGIVGGIKLTGGINLCDPDKDGKIRPSEFIQMITEDPAAIVSVEVTLGAFILFYIEVLFLKFEFTIVDVVLFRWEYNPCDRQPILAVMDGTDLVFNTGSGIGSIDDNAAIGQTAEDRRYRNTDDGNESYTLKQDGGDITIDAVLPNNQSYSQTYSGVQRVRGYAGAGEDRFDASAISTPVYFVGGDGNDTLIGGAGDDTLVGGTGTTLMQGRGGDDLLVARGGSTTMSGQQGNDTYRFLSGWGTATMSPDGGANDRNVLDFSAQTQGVTVDDAEHEAFQGGNSVSWTAGTTLDQMWGGQGDDRLDFSGDEANLLVTVTGMEADALSVNSYSDTLMARDTGWTEDNKTNAGWVTNAASGMQQTTLATDAEQQSVGDQVGLGFKFVGFENVIGGQGSDVFRIRDGASVTGSLHGDTAQGLHHDDEDDRDDIQTFTGNENANARNTIDFSEYTDGVRVDQENFSTFGDAGASRIVVRGMHNMFGGQKSDYLAGDGRNNLIVGNDGADTLEGRSAHDLLVADDFLTWANIGRANNAIVVASYIDLEAAGTSAVFGEDGRRWVWLGQTLENRSLTTAGQTLRGGTGNDIQMGALGGDVFNDGGTAEGNDTIVADLGRMKVDFNYRTPLEVMSFGRRGGGNDSINLGTGSNIVIAGAGDDTVTGNDQADSFNIVLGDNGKIKFQSELTDVGGTADNWTLRANLANADAPGYSNHMVEYIRTEQDEAPEDDPMGTAKVGMAGNDTINLSSGSGVVIGGWGADTITMSAKASVESNTRYIAGDHAELIGDDNGGIVEFRTLDTVRANGGDDFIQIGDQSDLQSLNMGRNYVMAGMGADTVLISAGLDDAGVLRFGSASSEDVVVGDNGEMLRTESKVGDELIPNLMLRLQTIQNDKGDADRIALANGTKVVLGGVGGDTIDALNGDHLVLGDNGRLDYDSVADNGVLRTVTNTDIVIGGDDQITLGEGYTLAAGGKGNDVIEISATSAGNASGLAVRDEAGRLRYVAGVLGVAQVRQVTGSEAAAAAIAMDNSGRTGRFVSGDNTVITFDDQGGLIAMLSTDPIAATGGADTIRIGVANTSAYDLGLQAVVGGMGSDQIDISQVAVSSDVLMGDNGDYRRASRTYGLTSVVSTRTEAGGADSIRTGAGDKILIGGFGADVISAATLDDVLFTGGTQTTAVVNRSIAMGDSGQVLFDLSGAAALAEVSSLSLSVGGNDTVSLGDGDVTFVGGYGNDNLTVTPSKINASAMRVAFGDNASLRFAGIANTSAQAENLVQAQTLDQTSATGGSDTLTVGRAGATMGQVMMFGGMSADTLTVLGSTADSVLVGDNGLVNVAQVTTAPSVSGQQAMYWANSQSGTGVSMLGRVETLLPEQGTGDKLLTVNGTAVLIGGAGADRISAGRGQGVVFGDGAQVTYADGTLREARSFGLAAGLGDTIELGAGSNADGHKVVVGGAGADTLTLSSAQGTDESAAGRIERVVAGDNATLGFDAQGRLTTMDTPDADIATAGNDSLTVLISGNDVDRKADAVFMAGGLGDDRLVVNASGKTVTVASGDNLQMTRSSGNYNLQSAMVSQPSKGGNDTLRLGSGTVLAFGGVGNDQIDIASKAGDLVVAQGDAGYALFEVGTSQEWLSQIGTSLDTVGGNDTLSIGAGRVMALGGAGRDTIALRAADSSQRVVLGDTGQIDLAEGQVKLVQSTQDDADPLLNADTLVLPSDGQNLVIGGAGPDNLSAIVNAASRYMPGSGMLESTANGVQVVSVTVLGNPGEFGMRIDAEGNGSFPAIADDYELVRRDPAVGQTDGGSQTLELTLFGQGEVTVGQSLTSNGRIAYPALRSGLATFAPVLLVGTYGTLDLRKDGSWAYALGLGNDVGYDAQSTEVHTETFYLQTTDGSVTTVVVNVKGDAKPLADWVTADAKEATGLANNVPGVVSVGHVSLSSGGTFNGQAIKNLRMGEHVGDLGVLSISRDGHYTYTLNELVADELHDGQEVEDNFKGLFSYTDTDGAEHAGRVVVTVVGGNDRPQLSLGVGSVYTASVNAADVQTRSGSVRYEDVDLGDVLSLSSVVAAVLTEQGEELPLSDAQRQLLLDAFAAQRVNDGGTARLQGVINWSFAPTADTLAMIPTGQTVSIRFELVLQDALNAEHRMQVVVQAQGANEASSFGGDLSVQMMASDGQVTGVATAADADLDEDRFEAQVMQGQFGVLTMQADGRWTYVLNADVRVPPTATLTERFELATRDKAGQGQRPVVNVFIKGPDMVVSAAGNAPDSFAPQVPRPVVAGSALPGGAAPGAGAQPLQVIPLGGAPIEVTLGNMSPYAAPAGPGVTLPGATSQRAGSPNDPAAQSSEPQQPTTPQSAPDAVVPATATGQQAATEMPDPEQASPMALLDELTEMADSGSAVLSVMGMAAAMTLGKGQRIQWQAQKTAQPTRQRIQW